MIKKIIILLGLPGSGKGTQGHLLSEDLSIPHISTGDIFRKMASTESEEAKMLNSYMEEGKLVPSSLVNKVVRKFILSDECRDGCILDGYPRNLEQAEYFIENIDSDIKVIFFDVKDEVVIKRILGRVNCSECGRLYNKYFDNPKVEGVCDSCGSHDFTERVDDDEKTILLRIAEYKKETMPLIEYYKKKGHFFAVDASKSKEEISAKVASFVKRI
jgi:adenylate kinase